MLRFYGLNTSMRNFLYRIVSWSLPPSAFFQLTSTFRRFSFSPFQLSIHRQVSFPLWGQQLRSVTVIAFRSFPETPRGQFYWKQSLAWTRKIALTVVQPLSKFFFVQAGFFYKTSWKKSTGAMVPRKLRKAHSSSGPGFEASWITSSLYELNNLPFVWMVSLDKTHLVIIIGNCPFNF